MEGQLTTHSKEADMATQSKAKRTKAKSLEEMYKEIATWKIPDVSEYDDLSQPDIEHQNEPVETYVTYGVPPGM
jgi:hypothetical protein